MRARRRLRSLPGGPRSGAGRAIWRPCRVDPRFCPGLGRLRIGLSSDIGRWSACSAAVRSVRDSKPRPARRGRRKLNLNVLPWPGRLSSESLPPCARATRLAIASPKPVPGVRAARAAGNLWNSMKIAPWSAGAIPGPLSANSTTVRAPRRCSDRDFSECFELIGTNCAQLHHHLRRISVRRPDPRLPAGPETPFRGALSRP